MFGPIGGVELLVLVTLGLLVFGPRRLPEIGRAIGRTIADLRRAAMEVRTSLEREVSLDEVKRATHNIRREMEETLLGEPRRLASELNAPLETPSGPPPTAAAPPAPAPPDGPRQDAEPRG